MIYTDKTKRAIKLCYKAHHGQLDKSGLPYVHHPLHLAEQMDDEDSTVLALLHDVVEDTNYKINDIKGMDFGESVIDALALLTHDPAVPYYEYVKCISVNPLAAKVKLADLKHNGDITRLNHEPTEADRERLDKYMLAEMILENGLRYRYEEPDYEEVAHKEDSLCSVDPNKYKLFLKGFNYGMIAAEAFLRKQFVIEENMLSDELDRYRDHMIEFTWMCLREDPEYYFLDRYRAGALNAELLPPEEGDRFYDDIEYTLKEYPGYNEKKSNKESDD